MGTAEALALETLQHREERDKDRHAGPEYLRRAEQAGANVPYMVCVCSGYWVVEDDTRLGCPCAGGAIILPLLCRTGLNTCCP